MFSILNYLVDESKVEEENYPPTIYNLQLDTTHLDFNNSISVAHCTGPYHKETAHLAFNSPFCLLIQDRTIGMHQSWPFELACEIGQQPP